MKTPLSSHPIDIIRAAQEILFSILPPDSPVTHEQCISELLRILDSPECRLATARHAHAQALDDFQRRSAKLNEDRRAFQRLTVELFIEHAQDQQAKEAATASEAPDPLPVAQSAIKHLRAELDRVRKHETHLIQHRDELIQKLAAAEKRLEAAAAALR